MRRGPHMDIEMPERLNLATYYLEDNIAKGRGEKDRRLLRRRDVHIQ